MRKPNRDTKLKKAREFRGLSRGKAAKLSGISPTYWSTLERGENIPAIDKARRIARALGFTPDDIWPPEPPEAEQRGDR